MLVFAVLVVGFSGLIAQVLLLRELLVSFYGNELTLGIILANWVLLEAMGALLFGKLIDRAKKKLLAFGILDIIFIFSLVLSLYLARSFKPILNIHSGLGMGIGSIFWSSFLILLPVSLAHGGLFSFCVKIYASSSQYVKSFVIGKVYFLETAGCILAGIAFTYLFIPFLDSFRIVSAIFFLNLVMLWSLFTWQAKKNVLLARGMTVSIIFLYFLSFPVSDWLQDSSIKLQYKQQKVLDYANSIYGNVAVTQQQEQYTFFFDGLPIITTPYPDIIFVQEFAQIPVLFHPRPGNILIISAGVGGLINQLLKNTDVSRIDYVELDPLILKMVRKYPTQLTERELTDKRVNVINVDGRFFVKNTNAAYDIIFIGLSSPTDLQTNRLFTEEFFQEARERLNPGGILTFVLPGSLTYLGQELKDLNACVLNSLKRVYPYTRVIPGDFNLFLASNSEDMMQVDSRLISERISQRGLVTDLLLPAYIEYRLHRRWSIWFNNALSQATKRTNKDFSPFALFKGLSLWNAQFSPQWQRLFLSLENINLGLILGIFLAFTLIFLLLLRGRRGVGFTLPFAIFSTGFFGMLANLIIIFSFQVVYGYLYYLIAMLITLFMAGAALGSIVISRYLERIKHTFKLLLAIEVGIILWVFGIIFIILSYPPQIIFFLLCAVTGFWVGLEFPLVNKIYLQDLRNIGATVGIIYAADLLGGWFAAILSGILFLPILGLVNTCVLIFVLKLISLTFLFAGGRSLPAIAGSRLP